MRKEAGRKEEGKKRRRGEKRKKREENRGRGKGREESRGGGEKKVKTPVLTGYQDPVLSERFKEEIRVSALY